MRVRRPRPSALVPLALALALAFALPLAAQEDSAYAAQVRAYTTDVRFLPASVAALPASATVPSPQAYFGSIAGAPGVMHYTADIYGYFRALAKATPRVRVETLGTSEEGREIALVVIGNESDLARLGEYRKDMERLADPRITDEAAARRSAADLKPFYYLNGGLHSPEMGSPEMLMELAYRLAVSEEPSIREIRDNVVVLVDPVSEADGRDKQVDWYRRYTKGRPEWDDGFPRTSPYWGRYIVHDNSRDGLQLSAALTRATFKAYYDWHPVAPTLFHPGSIVRAKALRPTHPPLYGYPEVLTIFKGKGPLYRVPERDSAMVVLQYGTKERPRPDSGAMLGLGQPDGGMGRSGDGDSATSPHRGAAVRPVAATPATPATGVDAHAPHPPISPSSGSPAGVGAPKPEDAPYVVSGMVRNEAEILRQGAIFDVPVGKGRVLAFTFNPLHRFLSQATFPLVWNALMSWDALPALPAAPRAGEVGAAAR